MKLATRTFKREDWYITSPFGNRVNPATGKKAFHNGDDYGTHLQKWNQYALEDGIVTRVGYNGKGYGNYLDVQYPRLGIQLFYAHLDKVYVKKGDKVNENTILGITGTTGQSTGIHLHLGYKKIGGEYEDPESYDYQPLPKIEIVEPVERDENKNQVKALKGNLRVRTEPNLNGEKLGYLEQDKLYDYFETSESDGYTWYKIAEQNYVACVEGYLEVLPRKEENIFIKLLNLLVDFLNKILEYLTK